MQVGLMQCWVCKAVQDGNLRRCDACRAMTEVVYTEDGETRRYWPLDLDEYRRRGIVVKGYVNDLGNAP